jgi:hypothetical protein
MPALQFEDVDVAELVDRRCESVSLELKAGRPNMRGFVVLFCIALVVHAALGGIILAEGFLLHWLFPSLDVGMSVLLAAGIVAATVVFFFQMARTFLPVSAFAEAQTEAEEETEDDEEDDDGPDTPSGRYISSQRERPRDRRRRRRR